MDKAAFAVALLLCAAAAIRFFLVKRQSVSFSISNEAFPNPVIGYAPPISPEHLARKDIKLMYLGILWKDLEPMEGVFAWEQLEKTYQLPLLRQRGIHLVIRFICDQPGNAFHLDIPQWLYDRTGDGTAYSRFASDGTGRAGYSPNYSNPTFIAAHANAVDALGEHFRDDPLISYIELGSLGHWGEWHVTYLPKGINHLPSASIRMQYIIPWLTAFPHSKLLMRRPFAPAKKYGLGVYNDMAGVVTDTLVWLGWIQHGGSYQNEANALVPIPKIWNSAPVGGELASYSFDDLLVRDLEDTLSMIRTSHMSFLGPHIPSPQYEYACRVIARELGYRLTVTKLTVLESPFSTAVELTFGNSGRAPMYFDWPVRLYLESPDGETQRIFSVPLQLSRLLPGKTKKVRLPLSGIRLMKDAAPGSRLTLGIPDPLTLEDSIRLTIDCPYENGRNVLLNL